MSCLDIVEPLLATYGLALSGLSFAAWIFAFETRKTFKGGIFWNAWRIIASSVLFFMANQLVLVYGAVYGSSFVISAIAESLEALATTILLIGFYLFYKAWNPRAPPVKG
jgi:hypothetical protein